MDSKVSTEDFFASVATKSDSGALRGDYTQVDQNYVVAQQWHTYTPQQHA